MVHIQTLQEGLGSFQTGVMVKFDGMRILVGMCSLMMILEAQTEAAMLNVVTEIELGCLLEL